MKASRLSWLSLAGVLLVAGWLFWHSPSSNAHTKLKPTMNDHVVIEVGESADAFVQRNAPLVLANKQNPGMQFYTVEWPSTVQGKATIKSGNSELRLDTVLSIEGAYDDTYPEEGLSEFTINLGLPPRNNILHEQALHRFYDLLQRIQQAGWQRWIDPRMPRLDGQEVLRYQASAVNSSAELLALDPNYVPTLDEWMHLKDSTRWQFYLDRTLMEITLIRDRSRMDPAATSSYLLTIGLKSVNEDQRQEFQFKDRPHWKELYPAKRAQLAATRASVEEKLKGLGYRIDTAYQNPDELPQ